MFAVVLMLLGRKDVVSRHMIPWTLHNAATDGYWYYVVKGSPPYGIDVFNITSTDRVCEDIGLPIFHNKMTSQLV